MSRRENHDASAFYTRFTPPVISADDTVNPPRVVDEIFARDARQMDEVADNSVALVVTSPPYFVGKEYEDALKGGHVPATYLEYLTMLEEVFAECVRKLEPGGRLAVNVANLGRRPYRSLSSDIITILQDRLRLLLRGEVIWFKARGATGSCAWGSFQRPANPVLRDLTERIVIASKGRFDRALTARQRHERGLPSEASLWREEFMDATTDVWEFPAESATRVGHPAPFPVQLPERLINLYTYRGDLVLDPFMGSGTTGVAAVRTERHYVGYDVDGAYAAAARERIAAEADRVRDDGEQLDLRLRVAIPGVPARNDDDENFQARAVREGRAAKEIAHAVLEDCGFTDIVSGVRFPQGVEVNFAATDQAGGTWFFDVSGAFTSTRPGLRRTDTLWKAVGKAAVLHDIAPDVPLVLLTTDAPPEGTAGDAALQVVSGPGKPVHAVVELLSPSGKATLQRLAAGVHAR